MRNAFATVLTAALLMAPAVPPGAHAQSGPYQHQVHSATSADGLAWTRDAGLRVDHASVPCALADGGRVFLYYVDADRGPGLPESVGCAVSSNGIDMVKQPFVINGLPTFKAVDPSILKDEAGVFRLYYFGSNAGGDPASETNAHEIHLATSGDGIHFTEAGTVFTYPGLVDPDVFTFQGNWFLYVFTLGAGGGTIIATSSHGNSFTYAQPLALPGYGTVAPVLLDDGRLRLYAFEQTRPSGNAFVSFTSTDGVNWTAEPGTRLLASTNEQITDPFVVRWQGGWKMYFKSGPAGGGATNPPPAPNTNITVSFPDRPYRPAVGGTSGFFQTGQEADLMLAGIDFNHTGGPLLFNHPHHVGGDGTRVLLADRNNNRVLVWLVPPNPKTPPDLVLGQPDFLQNNPGTGLHQMNWPCAVSLASNGRLAIADTDNDRLLLWNSFPTSNGAPADLAVRLPQFPNPTPGRPPLGWPWGIWTDGARLVASATAGSALLFWSAWPAASNTPPAFILTNSAFGTPRALTSDGTFLAVDDHNAILAQPTQPFGHATFFWTNFPNSANAPFHFALSGRYRGGLVGAKLVMLGEGRMKIWNGVPGGTNVPPAQDLSGPWGSDGVGLTVAGGRTYTVDENSNAILGFDALPPNATGGASPQFAIGSPSPQTNTLLTQFFLQNPCPVSSGSNLFVSSDFQQRLCVWRNLPDQSGAWPDVVYQIPGGGWANTIFSHRLLLASVGVVYVWDALPLNGELPSRTLAGRIGTNNLGSLRGVAMDARFFYLADYDGQRVLVFAGLPATNDNPVAILSPGGRPGRLGSDGTWLAVPVEGQGGSPHSVKLYRVADLPGNFAPARSIQPPQAQLNLPGGCTVSHGHLFIADTSFNRVLCWSNVADAVAGLAPTVILGAANLADVNPEIGRDKLFMPGAVNFDGQYLWVGEFKFSSRLLRYSPGSGARGPLTFTAPLGLGGGRFNARVAGAAGQRFELQSSTNLLDWRLDGFRGLPTNGAPLDVSVPAGATRVFLRARSY
jgi:hypothetical protein